MTDDTSESKYIWQWKNKPGFKPNWVDFAPDLNEQLNTAHRQGLKGIMVKHTWYNKKGKEQTTNYSIDFKKYTQTNQDSWTERQIRCQERKVMGPGPEVKGACGPDVKDAGDNFAYQGMIDDDGRNWDAWSEYKEKNKKKTPEDAKDDEKTSEDAKDAANDGSGHDTAIVYKGTASLFQDKQDSKEVDIAKEDSKEVDEHIVLANLLEDKEDSKKEVDLAEEDKNGSKEVGLSQTFELMDWHHVALSGSQPDICPHWTRSPGSWTGKLPFDRCVGFEKRKKMYENMYKFISMCKNKNV